MSYSRSDEHIHSSNEARTAIILPDMEAGRQNSGSCCKADDITVAVSVASTRRAFGVGNHGSNMTNDTHDDGRDFGVEIHGFRGSGSVSGNSSSSGSDEWEAFDVAFEGKTVTSNLVTAREEELDRGEANTSGTSRRSAGSIYRPVAVSYGEEESGIMMKPGSNDSRGDESLKRTANNKEEEKINQNEHGEGDQQPRLHLVGLWGRRKSTRHWVDQCARRASSSDDSSSSSACASSSFESGYSETEDACPSSPAVFGTALEYSLFPLVASTGRTRELPSSTGQYAVADTAAAAQDGEFHNQNTPKRYAFRQQYQPRLAPQTARARRIPLSAYGAGDPATASAALAAERGNQDHNNNCSGGRGLISPRPFRSFACCVQLHGCLCEAPLAVLEGIARAPCYLLAAVWVAIVGITGASAPTQSVNRERLLAQARALAREGALLFAASLTLALPLSTFFTVYGDVSPEDSWDARPVPTILGAVDPLRFFVFAHGQAGELAANGRPEPLLPPVTGILRLPFASTGAINKSRTDCHSRVSPVWSCSSPGLSFSDRDGQIISGRHGSPRSAAFQSPTRWVGHSAVVEA